MSGPARSMMAPCSRPSTPLRAADCGGLRPALTAAVRGALRGSGRDGETALSRTKKHHCSCGPAILQNLTHVTAGMLLVHPGGPFWARKDLGSWSIPKGEYEEGEDPLIAAVREFGEETGGQVG